MKKKKIETRNSSISLAIPSNDNLVELIDKPDSRFYFNLPQDLDLKNLSLNTKFFYKIRSTSNEIEYDYEESGVGYIKKKNNKRFLVRDFVFSYYNKKEGFSSARNGKVREIEISDNEYLVVTSEIPDDYKRLFSIENSVMCCTDKFTPTPVELQNKTLLGKLNNIIQSIDKYELWSILSEHKDKESLKPVKGSIRYNNDKDCFEGYTGDQWRTLMWGDE